MKKNIQSDTANGQVLLRLTQDYLDKCIEKHIHVLEHLIKDEHTPPADGGILRILDTIDALRTRCIAKDDKAGRGVGPDEGVN